MALPIYTHIPNFKGLTNKLSCPKGNLCGGSMTVLNPKYPVLSSGDTMNVTATISALGLHADSFYDNIH